ARWDSDPDADVWSDYGATLAAAGRREEAIETFERALVACRQELEHADDDDEEDLHRLESEIREELSNLTRSP
ncbi:MAG: hypothetical protein GY725_20865, partial [bacterium]|nr:hypothetical protein [bacterium]